MIRGEGVTEVWRDPPRLLLERMTAGRTAMFGQREEKCRNVRCARSGTHSKLEPKVREGEQPRVAPPVMWVDSERAASSISLREELRR